MGNLGLASIDQTVLKRLSASSAVEAFRDLLWARAAERDLSVTRVSISADVSTADGGVDASILEDGQSTLKEDELLSRGRRFQIKTGTFEPWKAEKIKRELFGKKSKQFENLGSAIQRTLREDKELVFVCFGVDPVDEKLRTAKENLVAAFSECGFPNARVEVWGQTQLIGLFCQYPSLCLRLRGHDHRGFRFWSSWAEDADMQQTLHFSPEQILQLDELRIELQTGRVPHIRLLGEPGVGKTRMALELTRPAHLASVTLYLRDSRALFESSFLNEVVQDHSYRFVLLVIDECPQKDVAEIWNALRSKSNRIRLVTIDHGPDSSSDEKMRIVQVNPANRAQIISILKEYGLGEMDARRWAEFSEGCPRVAHVLGENLRQNQTDLLRPPATSDIWDRFIVGHDDPSSEDVHLRKIVLRYVALFERFGFQPPVEAEAKYIASMAESCDPSLTWPRFQSVIETLKRRRIIQGTATLYITPRLLHVHLFREFWCFHGSGFDLASVLCTMPSKMWHWLVAMLKYADGSPTAQAAIDQLLGPNGLFPDGSFPDYPENGWLLLAVAESSPRATLRCLQRTIGQVDSESLLKLHASRQHLVWALERTAVWIDLFDGSAELLLKLAEAENSTNGNNATGAFQQLFRLVPGLAATQVSASYRNSFLQDALNGDSKRRRQIALSAAKASLSMFGGNRIVGPEHQGVQGTIKFWRPATYGELWEACREVWDMLVEKLSEWRGEERINLAQAIITSAASALKIPTLESAVLDTIELLVGDADADQQAIVKFLSGELRFRKGELKEDVVTRLKSFQRKIDGHDFRSKLLRYVKYVIYDDHIDDELRQTAAVDEKLEELAREAVASPKKLNIELVWLMREDSTYAFCLAYQIATQDDDRRLLPVLISVQERLEADSPVLFLGGYLASIFSRDPNEWEKIISTLADKPFIQSRFADLIISSGMSDFAASLVATLCRRGCLNRSCLEKWWYFRDRLSNISEPVLAELVELLLVEHQLSWWRIAVRLFHTYYLGGDENRDLPEELSFTILTSPAISQDRAVSEGSHYWSQLANGFIHRYSSRTWELFREVLILGRESYMLLTHLDRSADRVLTRLFQKDPARAWDCIVSVLAESELHCTYGIQHWLADDDRLMDGDNVPGPIQLAPPDDVFAWVDGDVENRGAWLVDSLPRTLDKTGAGKLTRDFLAKYGKFESLSRSLLRHFQHQDCWGLASI